MISREMRVDIDVSREREIGPGERGGPTTEAAIDWSSGMVAARRRLRLIEWRPRRILRPARISRYTDRAADGLRADLL
jgi:hypothetical protein